MDKGYSSDSTAARKIRSQISYQAALYKYRTYQGLARISWVTWFIAGGTIIFWCFTAYQMALAQGVHSWGSIIAKTLGDAINVQPGDQDALTTVLIKYGAKYNDLIVQGQYWRFVTPIFLHANLLHVGLNMLNLIVLGVFLERIFGHLRFLLIYFLTGVVSITASFYFAPQEVSVGASGAIFGLVGAYSLFVLAHRRALPRGGIPAVLWLIMIVSINLGIGLVIPNVDNYAHIGGLLSGLLLGWLFRPYYRQLSPQTLIDMHSLVRRWPLALLTVLCTLILVIIAIYLNQTRS